MDVVMDFTSLTHVRLPRQSLRTPIVPPQIDTFGAQPAALVRYLQAVQSAGWASFIAMHQQRNVFFPTAAQFVLVGAFERGRLSARVCCRQGCLSMKGREAVPACTPCPLPFAAVPYSFP